MIGSVSATYVLSGLGMKNVRWYCDANGHGPAAMTGVVEGALAVASGLCDTVVAFRSMTRPRTHGAGAIPVNIKPTPDMAFKIPYGGVMASQWVAMFQQRHMHEYGTTPEQLGEIAISTRVVGVAQRPRDPAHAVRDGRVPRVAVRVGADPPPRLRLPGRRRDRRRAHDARARAATSLTAR